MKKRLFVFALAFVVALLALFLLALFSDHLPRRLFSPPQEARSWAEDQYDATFVEASGVMPTLTSAPDVPTFHTEVDASGKIAIRWESGDTESSLHRLGERIEAGPGEAKVELPNGQVMRLLAIAYEAPAAKLPAPPEMSHSQRKVEIKWCDPVSLEPIQNSEDLGLPASESTDHDARLFLAFSCSDTKARPVRFQFPSVFNDETRQGIGSSTSQRHHGDIVVYNIECHVFHTAPLRLSVPLSFGKTETVIVDQGKPGEFRFGDDSAVLEVLHASNGYTNSSSWGGDQHERLTTFRFEPGKSRSGGRSFTIYSMWPPAQGLMAERFVPRPDGKPGRWSAIHVNNGVDSINHAVGLDKLEPTRYRRYPELARCVLEIPGIPGLQVATNLFDVKVGPVRFEYENEVRQLIEGATALKWTHYRSALEGSAFPLDFPDPATTAADVLLKYEELSGTRVQLNLRQHELVEPDPHASKKGIVARIAALLRRIF